MTSNFILSAPFILPIDQSILKDGNIVVQNGRIVELGSTELIKKKYQSEKFLQINLPQSIILPGFVNAHSHLELTSLRDLPYPGNFTDWIRKIVDLKPKTPPKNYREGIQQGIQLMLQSGITTVGDHVSFNTNLELILKSPLRGILFIEVLGVVKEIAEDFFDVAKKLEKLFQNSSSLFQIYASPHSVHAIHPDILPKLFSKDRKVLSIHLGESEEEDRYFRNREGLLYEFISPRQKQSGMTQTTAIQFLESQNLLSNRVLAIHCNYLDEKDLALLQQHQISVVHCPSSHDYFSHRKFPFTELKERKINIALGTDSLASGNSLSMLDQLRLAQENYPHVPAKEWIRIATLGGAKALKMENKIGSITPNKKADLIAIEVDPKNSKNICDQILEAKKVNWMMIDGKIIF